MKKYCCLLVMLIVLGVVGSRLVAKAAATYGSYSGAVYAVTDYKSSPEIKKNTNGSAINKYTSSNNSSIRLASWVENTSNENCTKKVYYNTYGTYYMSYKNLGNCSGKKHHLAISTQVGVVDTAVVSGRWTPD